MRRLVLIAGVGVVAIVAAVSGAVLVLIPPRLPAPPRTDIVISDVTVLNPGVDRAEHQTITVRAGRIQSIRATAPGDPSPVCPGCIAIPGLIDAHVHTPTPILVGIQQLFGLQYLAHGVTSVRDMGAADDSVRTWAERLNAGREGGPRVSRCGPVLDGEDRLWPFALAVGNPNEGREAVRRITAEPSDCVKVYSHLDAATFGAIAEAAAEARLPPVGYFPHGVGLASVREMEVQHLTGFPYLHRKPLWSSDINPADLPEMPSEEIAEAVNMAKAQHLSIAPTISTYRARLTASDRVRFPPTAAAGMLPDIWAQAWPGLVPHPEGQQAIHKHLASVGAVQRISDVARRQGIEVLAGSDTLMPWAVPGDALLNEVDELATAFGSPEAALHSATVVNGRHMKAHETGILQPGLRADILLLGEDPTKDLGALRRWRIVIADGRRYDRALVDRWLASYRRHFRSPAYNALFRPVGWFVERQYKSDLATKS